MSSATKTKPAAVPVRLDPSLRERLEQIARQTESSLQDLIVEVLHAYVEHYDRQSELIRKRLAEAEAGGPFASHEEVDRWLASWGTESEIPRPKATIYTKPQR